MVAYLKNMLHAKDNVSKTMITFENVPLNARFLYFRNKLQNFLSGFRFVSYTQYELLEEQQRPFKIFRIMIIEYVK